MPHLLGMIVRTLLTGRPARAVRGEDGLALAAHFGYGVSCGALFGLLARSQRSAAPVLGVGYALLLWLISYVGWVPASGAMAPPHRDDRGRQLTLVAGHVHTASSSTSARRATRIVSSARQRRRLLLTRLRRADPHPAARPGRR
jgi:hypothetical protein